MFAWNCVEAGGAHLGTCIDRFYFGSCCRLPEDGGGGGGGGGGQNGVSRPQVIRARASVVSPSFPSALRCSPCAIVDIDGKCSVHFRATRSTTRRGWEISRTARKPASKLAASLRQRRRPRRRGRRPPPALLRPLSPSPPQPQPLQPPQRLRPPRLPRQ